MKRKGGTKGAIIYIAMHPEINEILIFEEK